MAKTILSTSQSDSDAGTTAAGATEFWWLGHATTFKNATEGNRETTWQTPGILSKLYVRVIANTTTANSTLTVRKNGVDTAMTVTITAGMATVFEYTTSSVSVSAGDRLCYKTVSGGTGTFTFSVSSVIFDATTGCVSRLVAKGYAVATPSVNHFLAIAGDRSGTTAQEPPARNQIKTPGVAKNAFINVSANARTTTTTFTLRKSGVDTAIVFTYAAGETGIKQDISNSISVAADDEINWRITTLAGTETLTFQALAIDYVTANNLGLLNSGSVGTTADVVMGEPLTWYFQIGGGMTRYTTEAQAQQKAREAFAFNNLVIKIADPNAITANSIFKLRVNGADTALSLSVTASGVGYFSNTTDTVTVTADDLVCYSMATPDVTGTATLTIRQMAISVLETVKPPAVIEEPVFGGGRVRRVYLGRRVIEEPPPKPRITIKRINVGKSQSLEISSARRLMLLEDQPGVTLKITGTVKKPESRIKIKIRRTKLPASQKLTLSYQRLVIPTDPNPGVTVAFNSVAVLNASQISLRMFDINKYDQRNERLQRLYKLFKITSYFESAQN